MPQSEDSREEALRRLRASASALEARSVVPKRDYGGDATSQAYRILAELIGGVLVGIAIGFGVDRLFHTTPWGLIAGAVFGFGVSIWMARRTANRLMAQAEAEAAGKAPLPSVIEDENEDQER